jgi:hypothetical protein
MMIISPADMQQDTIRTKNSVLKDTAVFKTDSLHIRDTLTLKDTIRHKIKSSPKPVIVHITDTTSVCERNHITDFTFYDKNNFLAHIDNGPYNRFPFIFTEINRKRQEQERATLIEHLKPGKELPSRSLHDDWFILLILVVAFLYSIVRFASKGIFTGLIRFFLFRGINDPSSRDIGGLFMWQSTILNLISFLVLGLFGFITASYYEIIPTGLSNIFAWLISLGVIITAVTLRHFVCMISGTLSGHMEVFSEYLINIYQFYRFSALLIFFIIILILYTTFLPVSVCIISGIVILILLYLLRVIRLLIIFINRNISIFYLILYLCALEILPVLVLIKYFTDLV